MPEPDRAAFLAEILIELSGPQRLELLSKVKTAINLRMQDLINEKLPLMIWSRSTAVRRRCGGGPCPRLFSQGGPLDDAPHRNTSPRSSCCCR